ncbi:MAG: hypothetical protein J6Y02_08060 [Pseudobutyrivibrio sp.]|nr:hypothetical protein [Pseudobutyrivibrio sp.]
MERLTKEELRQFEGKTLRVVTMNGGLLRNRDCAFYAATNEEEAMAFCEIVKKQLPEGDYEFSSVGFEVPDISYFSLLFDNNYPGFEIVNYGFFVSSELLYERRLEIVSKIQKIYEENDCLYVALTDEGRPLNQPVGNTHVTISFFTREEDARAVAEVGVGEHTIEMWITNPPVDTTVYTIDGEIVYGWEIAEATIKVWEEYLIGTEKLKNLVGENELHILASDDGSGAIMRCQGLPILFTTTDSLKEFAELNRNQMTHEFFDMTVTNADGIRIVVNNSPYAFIDNDEGRYVCHSDDLIQLLA